MAQTPLVVRDGNAALRNVASQIDANGNYVPQHSLDSAKNTYRFAATFTPLVTGAVTLINIKGSATKTVRIKRIVVGGTSTTNPGSSNYWLQRTSSVGTGGTAVTPAAAKHDPLAPAATAVVTHYTTAAQSAGTAVGGPLSAFLLGTSIITAPTTGPVYATTIFPEEGVTVGQAIVLRGASDFVEIQNKNAGNLPAGTVLSYVVELEEDDS